MDGAVEYTGVARKTWHGTSESEKNSLEANANAISFQTTGLCWKTYDLHKIFIIKCLNRMKYPIE